MNAKQFPIAKPANAKVGWTLDYHTLEEISENTESNEGGKLSLEDIEIIVMALAERGFVALEPNKETQHSFGKGMSHEHTED